MTSCVLEELIVHMEVPNQYYAVQEAIKMNMAKQLVRLVQPDIIVNTIRQLQQYVQQVAIVQREQNMETNICVPMVLTAMWQAYTIVQAVHHVLLGIIVARKDWLHQQENVWQDISVEEEVQSPIHLRVEIRICQWVIWEILVWKYWIPRRTMYVQQVTIVQREVRLRVNVHQEQIPLQQDWQQNLIVQIVQEDIIAHWMERSMQKGNVLQGTIVHPEQDP